MARECFAAQKVRDDAVRARAAHDATKGKPEQRQQQRRRHHEQPSFRNCTAGHFALPCSAISHRMVASEPVTERLGPRSTPIRIAPVTWAGTCGDGCARRDQSHRQIVDRGSMRGDARRRSRRSPPRTRLLQHRASDGSRRCGPAPRPARTVRPPAAAPTRRRPFRIGQRRLPAATSTRTATPRRRRRSAAPRSRPSADAASSTGAVSGDAERGEPATRRSGGTGVVGRDALRQRAPLRQPQRDIGGDDRQQRGQGEARAAIAGSGGMCAP